MAINTCERPIVYTEFLSVSPVVLDMLVILIGVCPSPSFANTILDNTVKPYRICR